MPYDRKAYYQRTKERFAEREKEWRNANRERSNELRATYYKKLRERKPESWLFGVAKGRAKQYGQQFTLTIDDIVIPDVCPVLGIPLFFDSESTSKDRNPNSPSIDRRDPSRGYTPDNIVIMSWRANHLKNDGNAAEFRLMADWMERQL